MYPIGVSNFAKLIQGINPAGIRYKYVDKTLMIRDLLNDSAEIILFTRPRRFGKTLALSMLEHFFAAEVIGVSTKGLFDDLAIGKLPNYMEYQGKYPVISISLKGLKQTNFEQMLSEMQILVQAMFRQHKYLLKSETLDQLDKAKVMSYLGDPKDVNVTNGIKDLCEVLYNHTGKKSIVLIDEYDTPINNAYGSFYKDATHTMRLILESALKDNNYLEKAVLTGIMRIAKESLFSGLNHIKVYSILSEKYSDCFGFTEGEVQEMCDPDHLDEIKKWYNGYTFGKTTIYNPWSIIHFLDSNYTYEPYWLNTGGNDVIEKLDKTIYVEQMEMLLEGEHVASTAAIDPSIVFGDLETNKGAFWNLLVMAGYLTTDEYKKIRVPNREVGWFFAKLLKRWVAHTDDEQYIDDFANAVITNDIDTMKEHLDYIAKNILSYYDTAKPKSEIVYHGVLIGLLSCLKDRFIIKSNRESGKGRYDIAMFPYEREKDIGVLIEIKANEPVKKAMQQIESKDYATELVQYQCKDILKYGISFNGEELEIESVPTIKP